MKFKYSVFFLLLGIMYATICSSKSVEKSDLGLDLPIFQGAYDIDNSQSSVNNVKSLSYSLKTPYPAIEVINFYNNFFSKTGLIETANYPRKWETHLENNSKGIIEILQRLSSWSNQERSREYFLSLEYVKDSEAKVEVEELRVYLQSHPYVDLVELKTFFSDLKESGEFTSFMRLLEKYRNANGEIEFAKATRENPRNKLLKKYLQIIGDSQANWGLKEKEVKD